MNLEISRQPIELLPEHLIDQIKAGEIVERPSAALKELLENAIDAGADEISVHIENNGLDLIAVEDNGRGMRFEDLPHAFCRHATSKLRDFGDIFQLTTYGFRGEALATVAAIARVHCSSAPAENPQQGGDYSVEGGRQGKVFPFAADRCGTSVRVRDLFYNTPARLKFVKSKAAEKNALKRIIHSFILAAPSVRFSVRWDDKDQDIFAAARTPCEIKQRIGRVFFKKKHSDEELIHFVREHEDYKVEGYAGLSWSKGHSGKSWFLFANGRLIEERGLHQSLLRKMEHFWPAGSCGHYLVKLDIPPENIDVNVHPSKTRVKFLESGKIYGLLQAGLEEAISERETWKPQENSPPEAPPTAPRGENASAFAQKYLSDSGPPPARVTSLGVAWHLLERPQGTYLLSLGRLLKTFWLENFEKGGGLAPIPLLINEPIEDHLIREEGEDFFRRYGLELERVDPHTLALRTIPPSCEGMELAQVLPPLIHWAGQSENKTLASLLDFLQTDAPFPLPQEAGGGTVQRLVQVIDPSRLVEKGEAALLSEALLEKTYRAAIRGQ